MRSLRRTAPPMTRRSRGLAFVCATPCPRAGHVLRVSVLYLLRSRQSMGIKPKSNLPPSHPARTNAARYRIPPTESVQMIPVYMEVCHPQHQETPEHIEVMVSREPAPTMGK